MAPANSLRTFGPPCFSAWLRQAVAGGRDRTPGGANPPGPMALAD